MAGVPPIWPDHRDSPAGPVPGPGEETVRSPARCGLPRRPISRLRARLGAWFVVPVLPRGPGQGRQARYHGLWLWRPFPLPVWVRDRPTCSSLEALAEQARPKAHERGHSIPGSIRTPRPSCLYFSSLCLVLARTGLLEGGFDEGDSPCTLLGPCQF